MIGPARLAVRAKEVLGELAAWLRAHLTATRLALALGILLRLIDFGMARDPWMDEEALAENVIGRPLLEFDRPLARDQLAPPGFLVAARATERLIGHSWTALRGPSLACSIAALFVTAGLCRRLLSPEAGPIALSLMAVSDDLIYYAGEFKQYSSDVLIALGCAWLAYAISGRKLSAKFAMACAAIGSLALWTSFPAIFVLAAGGVWLGLSAIHAREMRRVGMLCGIGACWLLNFAACYAVSRRMLGPGDWMWNWWDFSFLPLPPRSWEDWTRWFWTLANLPLNPGGLDTPFTPIGTGLLGLALGILGMVRLAGRRAWGPLALLAGPVALAILASTAHRYPFHGRVILFLAPGLHMMMAEGLGRLRRLPTRVIVAGIFLVVPLERWFVIPHMHSMRQLDSHGDQRNDLLDYLEYLEHQDELARRLRK